MPEATTTAAIVAGSIVDAAVGRGRVVHVYPNGAVRIRFGDGSTNDYPVSILELVSSPGSRDHKLQLAMCEFREWSTDWDRVTRDEPHSRRAWDDLYDSGVDLLRDFAKAAGVILDSDEQPQVASNRPTPPGRDRFMIVRGSKTHGGWVIWDSETSSYSEGRYPSREAAEADLSAMLEPPAATTPTAFRPDFPGSEIYRRDGSDFVLLYDEHYARVQVLGPSPYAQGNLSTRPVMHTVAVLADGLDDAIAAASAAVDHLQGR